jgi:hypothetical protein
VPSIIKVDQIQSDTGTVNQTSNLSFTGTGRRITGDFSNATVANRLYFQSSSILGTDVGVLPNVTSGQGQLSAHNSSDVANANKATLIANAAEVSLRSNINGTASFLPMTFHTGGSERMRITTAGVVELTSGQLKFPASQNASSDPNTLDDYEEGTFTPSFLSTGASFTYDSAYRTGRYTKIGNLVTFSLWCSTDGSAPTGTTSNTLLISGLPFTAGNSSEANAFALSLGELYNVVWTASKQQATAFVGKNTSEIRLYWEQSNTTSIPWIASNIIGATYLLVSGSYQV